MLEEYDRQQQAGRNLLLKDFEDALSLYPSEVLRITSGVSRKTLQQAMWEAYKRRTVLGLARKEQLPPEETEEILERFGLWV